MFNQSGLTMGASPPGPMDTSGYLPPFLLGTPATKSPSRSSVSRQLSTHSTRATGSTSSLLDRSSLGVGPSSKVGGGVQSLGGPPVEGLYDHPTASPARSNTPFIPGSSPERRQLSFSVVNSVHRMSSTSLHTHRTISTPGSVGVASLDHRTPPSPPQMDPFYTQGENLTSEDDYQDCWVTVFGFPPATSSYILEQFSQYGTILKHVVTSNGNWMHILYQSRLQAKKALSKNGKVYGNGIMVGVQQCIDKSVMESRLASSTPHTRTPLTPSTNLTPSTPGKRPTSIRPLTAAYQSAASQYQVAPANPNMPQKSSGIVSKALEYMFGW
ncbi:nucleoporin NUP35-like isoform X2 [Halichondria panicea]